MRGGFAPASHEAVRLSGAVGEGPLRSSNPCLKSQGASWQGARGHFFDGRGAPFGLGLLIGLHV